MDISMKCLRFLVAVLIIFGEVWCEDAENEHSVEEDIRETRQYKQEGWRVADSFHQESDAWTPRDEPPESLDLKIKRRRLRKRKRKPYQEEFSDDGDEGIYIRRFRPQRLDRVRDQWEEMNEEAMRSSAKRRRITPAYYAPQDIKEEPDTSTPYSSVQTTTNREEPTSATPSIVAGEKIVSRKTERKVYLAGLKSLLKKSGGNISLSEILQQKNLSLSELLKGGEHAISALTEKSVTEPVNPTRVVYTTELEQSTLHKRLSPSIGLMKTTDRNYIQEDKSFETLTDRETLEAQRKRFALFQPINENKFSSVNKMEVVTEPTTERRIFDSSYPEHFTTPQIRMSHSPESSVITTSATSSTTALKIDETIATEATMSKTTKQSNNTRESPNLPTTNAKLRSTTKKINLPKEGNSYPFNFGFSEPIKISINEILGFGDIQVKEENHDAPMKVSIDIEDLINKNKEQFTTPLVTEHTTENVAQNQTYVTARKEIMEIIEDPISRDNLTRILEHRNMTLDELVEQRERGFSQSHLADIFHNSTREPEPKEEPFIGHITNPSQSIPSLTREPKSRTFEKDNSSILLSTAETTASTTMKTEIETDSNAQDVQPFPWKQLYPDLFPVHKDADSVTNNLGEVIQSLERLDGSLSLASDEQLQPDEYDLYFQIPPGVKSALFVSLAIIGLSLVVFLTLLVVFRCSQRKKTRAINYCSSLSSKMRSPIVIDRHYHSNALRTFMNETVRKKKNYFDSNAQSMSDEIWESAGERKPSF